MNLQRQLRLALESGEVAIGFKESMKAIRAGKAKLLIVASNHPRMVRKLLEEASDVPIYRFKDSNVDLGVLCGRRHPISILAIKKPGESEILNLAKGE